MKAVSCLIGLCLLVGAINANFAWQQGQQYKYKVRGRAMTGISEINRQYAGIEMEYYQIVTVKSDGVLNVKTEDLQVIDTNEEIENGGACDGQIKKGQKVELPQELKHFLTSPMDLIVKRGVVDSIRVQGDLPTWAVNIKRAMASTFTLDTIGQNQLLQGNLNRPTESQSTQEANQESGFFYKVLEETVHGECPVYYTVSQNGPFDAPFQFQKQAEPTAHAGSGSASSEESLQTVHRQGKHQYQNRAYKAYKNAAKSSSSGSSSSEESSKEQPWPRAFNQLCDNGDQIYEIIKTVNFTACNQKPVLAYTTPAQLNFRPADNAGGSLWGRALVSRYVACGTSRQNYTILKITQNERFEAGIRSAEKVAAAARKNVTLISITQGQATPIQNPKTINSLVYQYDPKQQEQIKDGSLLFAQAQGSSKSGSSSSEERLGEQYQGEYQRQSGEYKRGSYEQQGKYSRQSGSYMQGGLRQQLRKPSLDQAPLASMLITPLKREGLKSRVVELMQQIGQDLVKTTEKDSIAEREVLSKISTVVKLLRLFNRPGIEELARKLTQSGNEKQEVIRSIFLDALAIAGTNPAVVYLLEQVKVGQLNGEEAAQTLSTLPMYIRTPTKELLEKYFEIIDQESVKRSVQVRTTAMLSFSTLLYNACINKQIKNTRFPVALYGEFCDESLVAQKYVPYFIQRLEKRLENGNEQDKHQIVTLLAVLGNLGHPDTIEIVQKIMDEETDQFIKTKAIFALKNMVQSRSKLNQHQQQTKQGAKKQLPIPVDRQSRDILTDEVVEQQVLPLLVSVAFDRGEHPQVRNAAIALLLRCTYADVAIWQQLSLSTWFEQSRNVRSFIYSSLKTLAQLETPVGSQKWTMQRRARAVLPLAKPIDASATRSHNIFSSQFINELNTGFAQQLAWFESHDSILPNTVYYRNLFSYGNGAAKVHPLEVSVAGNTIQKLASAFYRAVMDQQQQQGRDQQYQQGHQDLDQIKQLLNIQRRHQDEPIQGAIHLRLREEVERLWTFDDQTVQQLAQQIAQSANSQGELNVNYQKAVHLAESMVTMPTILGFPLVYHMRVPTLISIRGTIKLDNPQGKEISIQADLSPVYAWKIHNKLSFKVPFTGKKYQAGVQRHFVVEAPFSAVARRAPQGQIQLAITPAHLSAGSPSGSINLMTYHQIPYTAIITDEFYPTNQPQGGKMTIVHANEYKKDDFQNKRKFGQNALGLTFEIEEESEFPEQQEKMSGWSKFVRKFHSVGCAFNAAWLGSPSIRYVKRQVNLDIDKSETKTVVLLLAARYQRRSVARDLQSSEEGESRESQSNSQSYSQSNSGSNSGSSSSSSSESLENKQWFNIVRSPYARRQQQQRQQQQQNRKVFSSSESLRSSEFKSFSSSSSESQSNEQGQKRQSRGHVVVVALLGKKSPLVSLDELKTQVQRPLQKQSENTVQYLLQANLRHGQLFVRVAAGDAANQAAESLPQSSQAFVAIREAVKEAQNSKHQQQYCVEFEGSMDTPKKASRHIVAIRRHTLLAQDLNVKVQGKMQAGQNCRVMPLYVKFQGKLKRDQEMTEWARSKSPEAQKCKEDEKKGFSISQVCMDVSEQQAAALNEYVFNFEHSSMPKMIQNVTVYHVENLMKAALYPYMSENQFPESSVKQGTFQIRARLTPNKQFLNIVIRKPESVLTFNNIKTGRMLKAVLPLTATQTLYGNVKDRLLRSQSDSMCAIEKNYVNTFDNVTYSFNQQVASGCQHVLAKDCSGRYPMAVLVKDLQQTKGRTVTVILGQHKIKIIPQGGSSRTQPKQAGSKSSSESQEQGQQGQSRMTVTVDGQQQKLPHTIRGQKQQYVAEVMVMPNGGVQLVSRRIQVATDGARVIVYASNEFRNRTCGICGDFDNEKVAEMRSPKDFPLSSGSLLVASYALKPLNGQGECQVDEQIKRLVRKEEAEGQQQSRHIPNIYSRGKQYQAEQQSRRQQQQQARQQQQKRWSRYGQYGRLYGQQSSESQEYENNYFNKHQSSRRQQQQQYSQNQQQQQQQYHNQQQKQMPTQFRQHISLNPQNQNELCITVNNLPACPRGYAASKTTPKNVQAHCTEKNTQHAKELKQQVKQGQHVELAHKQTQQIHIQSPVECIRKAFQGQRSSSSSSEEFYQGRHFQQQSQSNRQDFAGKVYKTKFGGKGFQGQWAQHQDFCQAGQYVYGMKLTGDSADTVSDSQKDNRGLTAIQFLCATPFARSRQPNQQVQDNQNAGIITSQRAPQGNGVEQKQTQVCQGQTFVSGVIVHADSNTKDKTGITSVDLLCSGGQTIRGDTVRQGNEKKILQCPSGQRLCGLQTQIENLQEPRTQNDHFGLVNVKIACCNKQA